MRGVAAAGPSRLPGVASGGLRGVRATRSLKAGEELFRIPRELILDEDAADESAVAAL